MVIKMKHKPAKTLAVQDVTDEQEELNGSGGETKEEISQEIKIIAQEVQIVRALACNDVNKRNRQIRKLRKWLQLRARSSFTFSEDDFLRIWKGLYYNMWMSDKPLVQEELAEQLSQLLQCFDGDVELSVNFFGAFMRTMCQEWFGVDQWRMDKFLMLTRRMLRYMFRILRAANWSKESIQRFNDHMKLTVMAENSPAIGLTMHYLDIFFEELAKVSDGKINAEQVGEFVRPFVTFLGTQRDMKLVAHCRKRVINHLLYQSELGREYFEKYNAWKEMGFPTSSINDLEKVEKDESLPLEEGEKDSEPTEDKTNQERLLDPRAGNVDVFMPELPVDAKYVIDELETLLYKRELSTKCRKALKTQLNLFQIYQSGIFPLGVKTMPRIDQTSQQPLIKDKVEQLENLENELYGVGRKLKQLNKRKRRKLLKSLNFDEIDESNFDQMVMKAIPKQYLKEKERKKRAQAAMMTGWVEEEIEKEDVPAKKKLKINPEKKEDEQGKQTVVANKLKQGKSIIEKSDEPAKKIKKLDQITTTTAQQLKTTGKNEKVDTPKKLKVVGLVNGNSVTAAVKTPKSAEKFQTTKESGAPISEWDEPLAAGEIEYFMPSRKLQLKKANSELVLNPLARKSIHSTTTATYTPPAKHTNTSFIASAATPKTPGSVKRVKIALKHNTMQNPSEYIKQIKSSPNVPYDAEKKPGKGLLKPNSIPSPINPFYKKKIGLRLLNDTM